MKSVEKIELLNELKELRKVVFELEKIKQDKKRMQAQLLQAQKMEAIGKLAGGMAHDFNNLLTAIIGYGQLLYDEIASEDPKREILEEILNAASRAAGLTGQLLSFSRKNPVKLEVLDLNLIVNEMEGMIDRLIGEDIEFSRDMEEKELNVRVDSTQLQQVILNLIVNARDAMPRGGKLTMATEKVVIGDKEKHKIPYSRTGDFACLSVIDTGVGMERKSIRKIFDPFYTTKRTGTGLGLSVVHGIINKLKGWINVESMPGEGTTFKIYLPLSDERKTEKGKEITAISDLKGKGESILVVEDEEVTRKFIAKILRANGYSVLEAESIEEATETFNRNQNEIKMIFSDVVLSDGSGLEFAEGIIAKDKNIKILLSSGYIDEKAELSRITEKEFEFLEKPYNGQELSRKIREVLA